MLQIPEEFFRNETVHRSIGNDINNGVLSCGFLNKKNAINMDINIKFEYYGALLVISGEGIHVDDEGREYKLYPGCFLQRIPGKLHSTYVKPDGRWLEFFICFGVGLFEFLSDIGILDKRQDILYPGVNMAIIDTFTSFMKSLRDAPEEDLPLLLLEAQKIIFTIYSIHRKNNVNNENIDLVKSACQLINRDPGRRISGRQIADQIGIGYERFRKLFKSNMGIPPGEFIIQNRINSAKSLLIDTTSSVKEIALEMGFPDSFTFCKQFKKIVGVSPSEFKKKY